MTKSKTTKSTPAANAPAAKPARDQAANPEKKVDRLMAMLKGDGGAALAEITEATGWLPHSARAMLTGVRKTGVTLDKTKVDGVTRYAIKGVPAA